jgi:hypothetical protein
MSKTKPLYSDRGVPGYRTRLESWRILHLLPFPSPWSCGIRGLGEILELIYGLQEVRGKILRVKELSVLSCQSKAPL